MHVGDACLANDLRNAIALQLDSESEKKRKNPKYKPKLATTDILESLTSIRRQTAINPETGSSTKRSLRSGRVILRNLPFESKLLFTRELSINSVEDNDILTLLTIGVLALRRIGSGRNRGRGHVKCNFWNIDLTKEITQDESLIKRFEREI
ncbi:hypothetical protein NIES267_72390 (plasmid) [Calothrix parasitica NIES-267]|uniref:Uncharacterized protein n=1 Tax=Calothrix parasitica NIES-267 TaxID=1973488 RepID=A0A1Z4M2N4_9CYAN|nr:hypothetical protein NIES267_72390 [Calothrix parasitica NIES-267]